MCLAPNANDGSIIRTAKGKSTGCDVGLHHERSKALLWAIGCLCRWVGLAGKSENRPRRDATIDAVICPRAEQRAPRFRRGRRHHAFWRSRGGQHGRQLRLGCTRQWLGRPRWPAWQRGRSRHRWNHPGGRYDGGLERWPQEEIAASVARRTLGGTQATVVSAPRAGS